MSKEIDPFSRINFTDGSGYNVSSELFPHYIVSSPESGDESFKNDTLFEPSNINDKRKFIKSDSMKY